MRSPHFFLKHGQTTTADCVRPALISRVGRRAVAGFPSGGVTWHNGAQGTGVVLQHDQDRVQGCRVPGYHHSAPGHWAGPETETERIALCHPASARLNKGTKVRETCRVKAPKMKSPVGSNIICESSRGQYHARTNQNTKTTKGV